MHHTATISQHRLPKPVIKVNLGSFFLSLLEATFNLGYFAYLIEITGTVGVANWMIAVFWLALFVFELPTGYLVDKWGAKKAYIVASIIRAVAFIFFFFGEKSLALLITANILAGVSVTFFTGLFSMQTRLLQEKYHLNINLEYAIRNVTMLGYLGTALGTVIGFLIIRSYPLKTLWLAAIAISSLSIGYVLFAWETIVRPIKQSALKHVIDGAKLVFGRGELRFYSVMNFLIYAALLSHMTNWVSVFVPRLAQDPVRLFAATILVILLKTISSWCWKFVQTTNSLRLFSLTFLTAVFMAGSSWPNYEVALVSFVGFCFTSTWVGILIHTNLMRVLPINEAGVVSSFQSLFENFAGVLGYATLGWVLLEVSVQTTWLVSSLIVFLASAFFIKLPPTGR
jgi:predicted MFS family arabinose efflux permease